ncbi:MAG: recombination regulator RecX [Bacteroidales bacterium]|nr:recombination regulator RecX [Bacteroidales bacterium]
MKRALTKEEAMARAERMCSGAEYSLLEMRRKLAAWGISSRDAAEILDFLVDERYIDDARFAQHYAAEKLEHNRWGARKIYASLRAKGIDHATAKDALASLDPDLYDRIMIELIQAKANNVRAALGGPALDGHSGGPALDGHSGGPALDGHHAQPQTTPLPYPEKLKIARFMAQRGFDPSTTMEILK